MGLRYLPMQLDSTLKTSEVSASAMVRMSIPISLGFVGIMLMNTVDLIVVGRLGPLEMASVGLGNIFWSLIFMPGLGISQGLEFPVSFNFGAKRHSECRRVLIQGLWIVTIYSLIMVLIPRFFTGFLYEVVADKNQAEQSIQYFLTSLWGVWPALVFTMLRIYLQALGRVRPAFYVLAAANVVNLVLDLALVLGMWGFPKWGVHGAAVSTNISRIFMMVVLLIYVVRTDGRLRVLFKNLDLRIQMRKIKEILKIGLPAGLQVSFEGGVFSLSTILAATFDVYSSAAHQVVLNLAANTFMVPLGISSVTGVMVGQSYGRRNSSDVRRAGWLGFKICLGWMVATSLLFLVFPSIFLGIFTEDERVLNAAAGILIVAALFQISDGIQVWGTGALRGLGDTKTSMYANLIGHWGIGFPVGVILAFYFKLHLLGLWIGLATGLIVVAAVLTWYWIVRYRKISIDLG
jgi:multidrug resistance protein, MATE family